MEVYFTDSSAKESFATAMMRSASRSHERRATLLSWRSVSVSIPAY